MSSSYWCYRCSRFVRVFADSLHCPDCNGGFIESIENPTTRPALYDSRRHRFPAAAMYMVGGNNNNNSTRDSDQNSTPAIRRSRRSNGDRSPFNPVIVLRGTAADSEPPASEEGGGFELYYDDGAGLGLRQLPATMSEFLLGSGFDRLLDQLSQIEANGLGRMEQQHPPASKAAIEAMPNINVGKDHVESEVHCAVCKEAFDFGTEAREMPCKHIYHSDCILPWLAIRNSCPVCRHELPTDNNSNSNNNNNNSNSNSNSGNENDNEVGSVENNGEEETVGLTIWRLPGGGFAVGRFAGGRRGGERELPVVYTEMDGGFNNNGVPRRISWASRGSVARERGGFRRVLRSLFGCFGGGTGSRSSSSASSSEDARINRRSNPLTSVFSSASQRRRSWALEVNNGARRI